MVKSEDEKLQTEKSHAAFENKGFQDEKPQNELPRNGTYLDQDFPVNKFSEKPCNLKSQTNQSNGQKSIDKQFQVGNILNKKSENKECGKEKCQIEDSRNQKSQNEKLQNEKTQNKKSQNEKSQKEKSQSKKSQNEKSQNEKSQNEKSQNEKSQTKNSKLSFKQMTFSQRLRYIKTVITIEPLICCVVIAKMVCGPALGNLHFEKACKVNAGFNDTVCDAIVSGTYITKHFKEQNNVVQSYITYTKSWEIPVSSIVPVVLVLFLGSYSDRHKIRKPFFLAPIIGDVVAIIGSILNVMNMYTWPLEAQVVADRIIPSLFGAEKLIIMVSYAYIADISSSEMRTIRMAVIPMLLSVVIPVTQAVSGILFRIVGYIPILLFSLILYVIAFTYGFFKVKEPTKLKEDPKTLIRDLFNMQHVFETFKLLTKNKDENRTNFIMMLVLCFILTIVHSGEQSTFFLFVQGAYQWTVVDFSYFTTAGTLVNFVGLSVLVPVFTKVFNLHDIIIIIISYIDTIFVSIIFVVIQSPIGLYVGRMLSVLKPPGHAATRSQLTKYISREDTAKAMSLNTVVAAAAATVAAQVYHQGIYEYTRKTFPQAFFLFGIALHIVGVLILIWMYRKSKTSCESKSVESETTRM